MLLGCIELGIQVSFFGSGTYNNRYNCRGSIRRLPAVSDPWWQRLRFGVYGHAFLDTSVVAGYQARAAGVSNTKVMGMRPAHEFASRAAIQLISYLLTWAYTRCGRGGFANAAAARREATGKGLR